MAKTHPAQLRVLTLDSVVQEIYSFFGFKELSKIIPIINHYNNALYHNSSSKRTLKQCIENDWGHKLDSSENENTDNKKQTKKKDNIEDPKLFLERIVSLYTNYQAACKWIKKDGKAIVNTFTKVRGVQKPKLAFIDIKPLIEGRKAGALMHWFPKVTSIYAKCFFGHLYN